MTALRSAGTSVDEVIAALRPGVTVQVEFLGQPPAAYRCVAIPGSEPSTMRIGAHPELLDRARAAIRTLEADLAQLHAAGRRTATELAQVRTELVEAQRRLRRAHLSLTGLNLLIQEAAAVCDQIIGNRLSGPAMVRDARRIRAALTPTQPSPTVPR